MTRRTSLRSGLMSGAMVALVAACGARSSLLTSGASSGPSSSSSTSEGGGFGGNGAGGGAAGGGGGEPKCFGNPANWEIERYRDQGDYERTAVAVSGQPWVALKVKDGNVILASLDIDPAQGIVFTDKIEVPSSPVYPVALDVDDRRFVMLTTSGINFNGELDLWRIDRVDGSVIRLPVLTASDPNSVLIWSIALAGDDIVIGRGRAAVDGQGTVELRDDHLDVLQSLDVPAFGFTAVKSGTAAVDVYCQNGNVRVHAAAQALTQAPTNPKWPVIGGLDPFLVEASTKIRLADGAKHWDAPWPHTQISPPAIVRTDGARPAVVLETELTAVVGHVYAGVFQWMPIIPSDDAPGTGLGLLPKIDKDHLGFFYLGLEIPSPQQPLRYFGRVCRSRRRGDRARYVRSRARARRRGT